MGSRTARTETGRALLAYEIATGAEGMAAEASLNERLGRHWEMQDLILAIEDEAAALAATEEPEVVEVEGAEGVIHRVWKLAATEEPGGEQHAGWCPAAQKCACGGQTTGLDPDEVIAASLRFHKRFDLSPAATEPGLDVERARRVFHDEYELDDTRRGCRHANQHKKSWDCWRRVQEFAAEYARQEARDGE